MISRRARLFAASMFLGAVLSAAAHADDCKLGRIASLDFTENGAVVVPVSLEGTSVRMAIDTGSEVSGVDPVVAGNLHLIEQRMFQGMLYDTKGEPFTYVATVHKLGMAEMQTGSVRMVVWPSQMSENGAVGGVLGADLLRHFDVDLDFGSHKLNLFSQDHCPGKVVYWTGDNVAVVPMHVVNSGNIIVPVTLDGHPFDAMLDTGATFSSLSMATAHSDYGLTPNSPDVTRLGNRRGVVGHGMYEHTFKSLSIGGLSIANPTIHLEDNLAAYSMTQAAPTGSRFSFATESGGNTDLTIGLNELRHLHLYIAYKEQKLYMTPASATANSSSGAAAPPGPTSAAR
ncbi:MAG TPA: pepsin/retropepsin-like aspartic protease family protein [Rhizomicrobium sp.]|jgi:hypothetical protein